MFSWGLVIVFSAFMIQVINMGIMTSIGLYSIEFLEYFGEGTAATSLIGAINFSFGYCTAPIVSFFMKKFQHRTVCLFGTVLSTVGLICVPYAPNVFYLYVFYGVIVGFGFSTNYLPSHVLSGLYFDKKYQTLATGVATSGSGFGGLVFPFLVYYLIEEYGWKGSMYILAGINLHNFIFSALLRPLHHTKTINDRSEIPDNSTNSGAGEGNALSKNTKTSKPRYVICNISFDIFLFNNLLWNMGIVFVLVLGPEYFTEVGLTKENAAFSLTLTGVGTFSGSIIGGIVGNIKGVIRFYLYVMSNILLGILVCLFPLPAVHNIAGIYTISISWGIMWGILLGVLIAVTDDIVGTSSLGDGVGYVILVSGIGITVGPPIGGLFRDYVGSFTIAFCLDGALILFSGFLMFILPLRKKHVETPQQRESLEVNETQVALIRSIS